YSGTSIPGAVIVGVWQEAQPIAEKILSPSTSMVALSATGAGNAATNASSACRIVPSSLGAANKPQPTGTATISAGASGFVMPSSLRIASAMNCSSVTVSAF